jgi:hypothetical protein
MLIAAMRTDLQKPNREVQDRIRVLWNDVSTPKFSEQRTKILDLIPPCMYSWLAQYACRLSPH